MKTSIFNVWGEVKDQLAGRFHNLKLDCLAVWVRVFPRQHGPVVMYVDGSGFGDGSYTCLKHGCDAYECECAWPNK
jgi:hypothetical protein